MKLLSTRIRWRVKRCRECKGRGWYWYTEKHWCLPFNKTKDFKCDCMECFDWRKVLREVRVLERKASQVMPCARNACPNYRITKRGTLDGCQNAPCYERKARGK